MTCAFREAAYDDSKLDKGLLIYTDYNAAYKFGHLRKSDKMKHAGYFFVYMQKNQQLSVDFI